MIKSFVTLIDMVLLLEMFFEKSGLNFSHNLEKGQSF